MEPPNEGQSLSAASRTIADVGNQPTRLAQFDDGNDRAILVQGDEGPAQVVRLGHRGTPSVTYQRRWCHLLAARPIPSLRWREMDSNPRSPVRSLTQTRSNGDVQRRRAW